MKLYSIVQYKFTKYPHIQTGIEYIYNYTLSEESFNLFLDNSCINSITFNLNGEQVHNHMTSNKEFYNGLYKDVLTDKNYIISCINI